MQNVIVTCQVLMSVKSTSTLSRFPLSTCPFSARIAFCASCSLSMCCNIQVNIHSMNYTCSETVLTCTVYGTFFTFTGLVFLR